MTKINACTFLIQFGAVWVALQLLKGYQMSDDDSSCFIDTVVLSIKDALSGRHPPPTRATKLLVSFLDHHQDYPRALLDTLFMTFCQEPISFCGIYCIASACRNAITVNVSPQLGEKQLQHWTTLQCSMLELYVSRVAVSRGGDGLRDIHFASFDPVLESVSQEDFLNVLMPAFEKHLKKSADSFLPVIERALRQLHRVDLSMSVVKIFLPTLLRQLRSAKEDIRKDAVVCFSHISDRTSKSDVRFSVAKDLVILLQGKSSGILSQWNQREAVLHALSRIVVYGFPGVPATDCSSLLTDLCGYCEKESHEPTKILSLRCLATFASVMQPEQMVPNAILRCFKKSCEQSSATVSVAGIESLQLMARASPHLVPILVELFAEWLLSLIKGASDSSLKSKSTVFSSVASSALWLILELSDVASNDNLIHPWPAGCLEFAFAPNSLVSQDSSSLIAAIRALTSCAAVEEGCLALRKAMPRVSLVLIGSALNRDTHVQRQAREAICTVLTAVPDARGDFLDALVKHASELEKGQQSNISCEEKGVSNGSFYRISRFTSALLCVCQDMGKPGLESTEQLERGLPIALTLCHLPIATSSSRSASLLWAKLLGDQKQCIREGNIDEAICNALVLALMSSDASMRQAGLRASVTLANIDDGVRGYELYASHLIPVLLEMLKKTLSNPITSHDLAVYLHPEGKLYGESSSKRADMAVASKNAMRKGKNADELEWEEQIKKDLAAKKQAAGLGGGSFGDGGIYLSPEDSKLVAEESATRQRIADLKNECERILMAMSHLFSHRSDGARKAASACANDVLAVLMDDTVCNSIIPSVKHMVKQTIASLAASDSEVIAPISQLLAKALVMDKSNEQWTVGQILAMACLSIGDRLLAGTDKLSSVAISLTPGPSLTCVLFVLASVLEHEDHLQELGTAHAEIAFQVLALHSHIELSTSDPLRLKMLGMALLAVRRFLWHTHPSPSEVLCKLCLAQPLSIHQWNMFSGTSGLLSGEPFVREACCSAVSSMAGVYHDLSLAEAPLLEAPLWACRNDNVKEVEKAASRAWDDRDEELSYSTIKELIGMLGGDVHIRESCGKGLSEALKIHTSIIEDAVTLLFSTFEDAMPKHAEVDEMESRFAARRPNEPQMINDLWEMRLGIAGALEACVEEDVLLDGNIELLQLVFNFIVGPGLADSQAAVRCRMLSVGTALVLKYGKQTSFLEGCETIIKSSGQQHKDGDDMPHEWRREGAVVLLGSAASHLDGSDTKVLQIVDTLCEALSTPSEPVQQAVADSLATLCKTPTVKERGGALLELTLNQCLNGKTYGERRGGAYGVAALVKGVGIATLKREKVMSRLEAAVSDPQKGSTYHSKQGALCSFECLSNRLGMLFEPYVINILPLLLTCFSDSSDHVRTSALEAARTIMSNLSGHSVKLILPTILKSLSNPSWRTKQAAIQLLGAMAYLSPKQLSSCLPTIVSRLVDTFSDTHPKVREAGNSALEAVASVIRNPEVAKISHILMSALRDLKMMKTAISTLLETEFMHSINAPSLALLMPVLQRGLKDRSADTKRKSALIVGNMCAMASDPTDLAPYMSSILPGLKATVVDPIPDVRTTSAKALGMLVEGTGSPSVGSELVQWLLDAMCAQSSSSERSGAAQGLASVVVALGPSRAIEAIQEEILPLATHTSAAAREGALWAIYFFPSFLGDDFTPFVPDGLRAVLNGLADESEMVRDVAMQAGHVIVSSHGKNSASVMLPALETGIFEDNWRIRQSSVYLLGDMLRLLSSTDSNKVMIEKERRNSMLAALYLVRSDTAAVVRQAALQVWKAFVSQTPRTLKEILPVLIERIISALGSGHGDKQTVAGRALGDVVKKWGAKVLSEVVPFLVEGLRNEDRSIRQGVCVGLTEIIKCADHNQVENFLGEISPAVQQAVCDPSPEVREEAALAFQALHRLVGQRAIGDVIPSLVSRLNSLNETESETAIFGLCEVLRLRPKELLSFLIPKLLITPISLSHARALAETCRATPRHIHMHLKQILRRLVDEIAEAKENRDGEEQELSEIERRRLGTLHEAGKALVTSVEDVGMNWLCTGLSELAGSEQNGIVRRSEVLGLMRDMFEGTKTDLSPYIPILLKTLLQCLVERDTSLLQYNLLAARAFDARVGAESLSAHISFARGVLNSIFREMRQHDTVFLPGLNIKRGLEPWLPMFQYGLLNGSADTREIAARGIGDLVQSTEVEFLKPFLIKLTGPLIRVAGERFQGNSKAAIIETLSMLLEKGGLAMKPFAPQLQTTFFKSLADPSPSARTAAGTALHQLVPFSSRVDPLVGELSSGALSALSSAASIGIATSMLAALCHVLTAGKEKVSDTVASTCIVSLLELIGTSTSDQLRQVAGNAIGYALASLSENQQQTVLKEQLYPLEEDNIFIAEGKLIALASFCLGTSHSVTDASLASLVFGAFRISIISDDKSCPKTTAAGIKGMCALLEAANTEQVDSVVSMTADCLLENLPSLLKHSSPDVRKAATVCCKDVAKMRPDLTRVHLSILIPPLVEMVKGKNITLKLASERSLLYLLEMGNRNSRPETLTDYVTTAEPKMAKFLRDYARRVLSKVATDSDDENETYFNEDGELLHN